MSYFVNFYDSKFTGNTNLISTIEVKQPQSPEVLFKSVISKIQSDTTLQPYWHHAERRCYRDYMYVAFFPKLKESEISHINNIMSFLTQIK